MDDRSESQDFQTRGRVVGTTRPISGAEKEVMKVGAEIIRRKWGEDVSDELAALMVSWALRLRNAYDEIIEPIRIRRNGICDYGSCPRCDGSGAGPCGDHRDELPGMWEQADFTGGETDNPELDEATCRRWGLPGPPFPN